MSDQVTLHTVQPKDSDTRRVPDQNAAMPPQVPDAAQSVELGDMQNNLKRQPEANAQPQRDLEQDGGAETQRNLMTAE